MFKEEDILKWIHFCCSMAIILVLVNALLAGYILVRDIAFYKNNNPDEICSNSDLLVSGNNEVCIRRQIVSVLLRINEMPISIKKHTAIYIPKHNRHYWLWGDIGRYGCHMVRFISPMFTGIMSLYGDMDWECANFLFLDSDMNKYDDAKKRYSDKKLCKHAIEQGVSQVIILDYMHAKMVTKLIQCEE